MSNNQFPDLPDYYAQASGMIEKFGHMNEKMMKSMVESMAAYTDLWVEFMNNQQQRLSGINNPADVVTTEAGLAAEYANQVTDRLQHDFNTFSKLQAEFMEGISQQEVMKEMDPFNNPFLTAMQSAVETAGKSGGRKGGNSGKKAGTSPAR